MNAYIPESNIHIFGPYPNGSFSAHVKLSQKTTTGYKLDNLQYSVEKGTLEEVITSLGHEIEKRVCQP